MNFNELFADQLKINAPLTQSKYNDLSNTGKLKQKVGEKPVGFIVCTGSNEEIHYTLEFSGCSYAEKYIADNKLEFVEYRGAAPVMASQEVIPFIKKI